MAGQLEQNLPVNFPEKGAAGGGRQPMLAAAGARKKNLSEGTNNSVQKTSDLLEQDAWVLGPVYLGHNQQCH